MLEQSYGLSYFLKSSKNQSTTDCYVYIRITVDGIPKKTSTKRQWDSTRWNQKTEKAIGTKEDARALNSFLETLTTKINNFKTELLNSDTPIHLSCFLKKNKNQKEPTF
ncbi:Arm DNA-binding domain-containing protein [Chryseobacterium contaminans]|uniref:Arm DNA-binding domain-containing protein n=1 Tax=Chryseobacterium contaminans TaxID=1423959 RepID=UPI003015E4F2